MRVAGLTFARSGDVWTADHAGFRIEAFGPHAGLWWALARPLSDLAAAIPGMGAATFEDAVRRTKDRIDGGEAKAWLGRAAATDGRRRAGAARLAGGGRAR